MLRFREHTIPAARVRSLCWSDGHLVDWVAGGDVYHLDGRSAPRRVIYAYRFDAAVVSPSGEFAVIYERLGTKGLLLHRGEVMREINRSFYHATAYEYPITLFRAADGREYMVHCPEQYKRLEIDDTRTGERLTRDAGRNPRGMFHSRLAVSPSGSWLLSAGWVWHPWDTVALYDIPAALHDPQILDGWGDRPRTAAEVSAAAFVDDERLILTTSDEPWDDADDNDPLCDASPYALACYDIASRTFISVVRAEEQVGRLMPIGTRYAVGFWEHPKVFDLSSGLILHRWPSLSSGKESSSIQHHIGPMPPLALDPANRQFAVADDSKITVVEFDIEE